MSATKDGIGPYLAFYTARWLHSSLDGATPDAFYFANLPALHKWHAGLPTAPHAFALQLGRRASLRSDARPYHRQRSLQDEFDLSSEIEALDFRPELVLVRGSLDRLVIPGHVEVQRICRCDPVSSQDEAASVAKEVDELRDEAAYEAAWDKYCTAEHLGLRARVIAGRLVDPCWQEHARKVVHMAASF